MFSLLAEGQQLEQKSISDRAMLPLKETRELLYRLMRANYLTLQVPPSPFLPPPHPLRPQAPPEQETLGPH